MRRILRLAAATAAISVVGGVVGVGGASAAANFPYSFDSNNQGWQEKGADNILGDAFWTSSGGNPGGAVTSTSTDAGVTLVSPPAAQFASDQSDHFGGTFSFDVKTSVEDTAGAFVLLYGDDTDHPLCVVQDATFNTTYTTVSLPLETGNVFISEEGNCVEATGPQIADVLSSLQRVEIPLYGLASGTETTTVDNIDLSGGGPPPNFNVKRTLSLSYKKKSKTFKGKLKAPKNPGECAASAKVTVYRKHKGPDKKVGSPKTNSEGSYKLKSSGKKGTYYAAVSGRTGGNAICKAAKSGSVRVR